MNHSEQGRAAGSLDLARLEADVIAARPGSSLASIAMPDYVEHQAGVPRVGALSAEAVVRDYEAAAKEIEAMGAELISAARKCARPARRSNAESKATARSPCFQPRKPRPRKFGGTGTDSSSIRSRARSGVWRGEPSAKPITFAMCGQSAACHACAFTARSHGAVE
jgi:hypothetical protein